MYIHKYICTYIYTKYVYVYTHVCMYMCVFMYICVYLYICKCILMDVCIYMFKGTLCIHIFARIYVFTYSHPLRTRCDIDYSTCITTQTMYLHVCRKLESYKVPSPVYIDIHCTCIDRTRLLSSKKMQNTGFFYRALLQTRTIILRSLRIVGTPYAR